MEKDTEKEKAGWSNTTVALWWDVRGERRGVEERRKERRGGGKGLTEQRFQMFVSFQRFSSFSSFKAIGQAVHDKNDITRWMNWRLGTSWAELYPFLGRRSGLSRDTRKQQVVGLPCWGGRFAISLAVDHLSMGAVPPKKRLSH